MFNDSSEVLKFIRDEDVKFLDIRFTDLPGVQQHFNIPASTVDEDFFTTGQMFDGSSIRGFASIDESDLQLIPDVTTAYLDPFREYKTLVMVFDIYNPRNGEIYSKDPRQVAKKAEKYLASTGIADTAFFAPEAEFYIFDDVRYEVSQGRSFYAVDSEEAAWNTGRKEEGGNLANKTPFKGGYFPVSPVDKQADLRDDISTRLDRGAGLELERAHHEVGSAGQAGDQLPVRHDGARGRRRAEVQVHREEHRVTSAGKTATFMPKPLFGDNGSGMHTHQSLWKDGEPLFYDEQGYGQLSDIARWYIGGILAARAGATGVHEPDDQLLPPTGARASRRRSTWCTRHGNRSAAIRIPITGSNPKAKRIEFRAPDASSNPYFAFAAKLMAGIDGIKNRIEPPSRSTRTSTSFRRRRRKSIPQVPTTLPAALDALREDHAFLLEGGVFTRGAHRDLDRVQDGERDPPDGPAPPPLRVRALLRRVTSAHPLRRSPRETPPGGFVVGTHARGPVERPGRCRSRTSRCAPTLRARWSTDSLSP